MGLFCFFETWIGLHKVENQIRGDRRGSVNHYTWASPHKRLSKWLGLLCHTFSDSLPTVQNVLMASFSPDKLLKNDANK